MLRIIHWPKIIYNIVRGALGKFKVNFLIVGTQKGGTTALAAYLRNHPQICMPNQKEVHFFDREKLWPIKFINYCYYNSNFSPSPDHIAIGESTPIYMYWFESARRIWEYNPDMKIIMILRNPIERAYSNWNMERAHKNETLGFWEAILNEERRCKSALPYQHRIFSYLDRGFYCEQIKRYLHFFPKEQILILKNENLRNNPTRSINKVTKFLHLKDFSGIKKKNVHSRKYLSKMSASEKRYLKNIYRYEIQKLEEMLEWNCLNWLQ